MDSIWARKTFTFKDDKIDLKLKLTRKIKNRRENWVMNEAYSRITSQCECLTPPPHLECLYHLYHSMSSKMNDELALNNTGSQGIRFPIGSRSLIICSCSNTPHPHLVNKREVNVVFVQFYLTVLRHYKSF